MFKGKRGGKASRRGLSAEQIPVIVARDRSGAILDAVLPRLDAASITAALGYVITQSAELCCDGGSAITAFARRARIKVHVLPAPGSPRPEAPDLHINNVNATMAASRNGCGPSTASPRRTCRAISASGAPSKPSPQPQRQTPGSWTPWDWDHINRQRSKSVGD